MIIGLTGYKRSGKNEVAKVLENFGWHQVAFADALKSMALAIDPWILIEENAGRPRTYPLRLSRVVELGGWEGAKKYDEVRRLLQQIGTEGVRDIIGDNTWLDVLQTRMAALKVRGTDRFVITDVRFPNEGDFVHSLGGTVWRITRPGYDGDGHASETNVAKVQADLNIPNDGTLEELWDRVVAVMPQ